MRRLWLFLYLICLLPISGSAREFTVLVYNVENLFDLDGIAIYDDYEEAPFGTYGVQPLLNKLESIRRTLHEVNLNDGPDVILFQEFELDLTPFRTPDAAEFIAANKDIPLADLLQQDRLARTLPSELLLLKYLEDHGMSGYHIAQPDPLIMREHAVHKNVVFSRFPINYVRQEAKHQARDLLEVGINIDGRELIVLNNHWKSGASNPETEPIRAQNAMVVRARLDSILLQNPLADVIVAGDLNSYYNHKAAFPDLAQTAVNDVLRSAGYESRMLDANTRLLYNLWYDLPPEQRGSEVYRGSWGTLMQMLLTPGLYDLKGIQYVDNSFGRLIIAGVNVDSNWNRPRRWTNLGGGAGFSDHLPIFAKFRVVEEDQEGWIELVNPTNEDLSPDRPVVEYGDLNRAQLPAADFLAQMSEQGLVAQIGEVFTMSRNLISLDPLAVELGGRSFEIFSPLPEVRRALERSMPGDTISGVFELGTWRGNLQLVIQHPDWLSEPRIKVD